MTPAPTAAQLSSKIDPLQPLWRWELDRGQAELSPHLVRSPSQDNTGQRGTATSNHQSDRTATAREPRHCFNSIRPDAQRHLTVVVENDCDAQRHSTVLGGISIARVDCARLITPCWPTQNAAGRIICGLSAVSCFGPSWTPLMASLRRRYPSSLYCTVWRT